MNQIKDSSAENEFYHVLGVLSEECAELIQCISKIQRFGFESAHPDNPELPNTSRFKQELNDLKGAIQTLENIAPEMKYMFETDQHLLDKKEAKITMMLEISKQLGRL